MLILDLAIWIITMTLVFVPCRRLVVLVARVQELEECIMRARSPPPHHGHHDVKGQGREGAPEAMVPDSLWQSWSRVQSGRAKLQFYEVGASFFR
jgi:hypothetical protein